GSGRLLCGSRLCGRARRGARSGRRASRGGAVAFGLVGNFVDADDRIDGVVIPADPELETNWFDGLGNLENEGDFLVEPDPEVVAPRISRIGEEIVDRTVARVIVPVKFRHDITAGGHDVVLPRVLH